MGIWSGIILNIAKSNFKFVEQLLEGMFLFINLSFDTRYKCMYIYVWILSSEPIIGLLLLSNLFLKVDKMDFRVDIDKKRLLASDLDGSRCINFSLYYIPYCDSNK